METIDNQQEFFITYTWMRTELKLKGLKSDLYAIIYSFAMQGLPFSGSTKYLCDRTGYSARDKIITALNQLCAQNLLIKIEDNSKKHKPNVYTINQDLSQKAISTYSQKLQEKNELIAKSDMTYSKKLQDLSQKAISAYSQKLPNNKYNNKDIYNNKVYENITDEGECQVENEKNFKEETQRVLEYYTTVQMVPSPNEVAGIQECAEVYGASKTIRALKKALASKRDLKPGIRLIQYARGILKDWAVNGEDEARGKRNSGGRRTNIVESEEERWEKYKEDERKVKAAADRGGWYI